MKKYILSGSFVYKNKKKLHLMEFNDDEDLFISQCGKIKIDDCEPILNIQLNENVCKTCANKIIKQHIEK